MKTKVSIVDLGALKALNIQYIIQVFHILFYGYFPDVFITNNFLFIDIVFIVMSVKRIRHALKSTIS